MDQVTIEALAAAVTSKFSTNFLLLIILQLALSVLTAGIGAYAGAYLRRRGENLATKQDFNSLLSQVEANTRLVETVKSEIGLQDWTERQWRQLRIVKLEVLTDAINEYASFLERLRTTRDGAIDHENPLPKIESLQVLYFPELESHIRTLAVRGWLISHAYMNYSHELGRISADLDAGRIPDKAEERIDLAANQRSSEIEKHYPAFKQAIVDALNAARNVLLTLTRVQSL